MVPREPAPGRHEQPDPRADVAFWGYCGRRRGVGAPAASRVCDACQMGLILRASRGCAPTEGDAFLVVDDLLRVRAVSEEAERLLGARETDLVDSHLGGVLVSAEAAPAGGAPLGALVARAGSSGPPVTVAVRPSGVYGVRYAARIGPCWPMPAALILLDDRL
jgi:hypothetical protein